MAWHGAPRLVQKRKPSRLFAALASTIELGSSRYCRQHFLVAISVLYRLWPNALIPTRINPGDHLFDWDDNERVVEFFCHGYVHVVPGF